MNLMIDLCYIADGVPHGQGLSWDLCNWVRPSEERYPTNGNSRQFMEYGPIGTENNECRSCTFPSW